MSKIKKDFPVEKFGFDKRKLSYSTIKHMLQSPRHFAHNWHKPKEIKEEWSLGSAVDCLLLTPERYEEDFAVSPEFDNRSKKGVLAKCMFYFNLLDDEQKKSYHLPSLDDAVLKELRETFPLLQADCKKTVISKEQEELAKILVERLSSSAHVKRLINNTTAVQQRLEWKDKSTGLELVGYLDSRAEVDNRCIVWDLKTARSADTEKFIRQALDFGYHIQAGAYWTAEAMKGRISDFYFVVIETEAPFAINVLRMDGNFMTFSKQKYREALDKIKYCIDNDCFDEDYLFLKKEDNPNMMALPGYKLRELEK